MSRTSLAVYAIAGALLAACTTAPANTKPSGLPTGGSTPSVTGSAGSTGPSAPAPLAISAAHPCVGTAPRPVSHIVVVLMENKAEKTVMRSSRAPFINRLAAVCSQATAFHGVAHPSLPNYLALAGGSTFGVHDDALPPSHRISAPSIFGQLPGRWRSYQESMDVPCQQDTRGGLYAPRHNPAAYFTSLTDCKTLDVPMPANPAFDAAFTFVTPNLQNDMHDGPVQRGDQWLSTFVGQVIHSPQYQAGTLALFVTWDENEGPFHASGNQVPLLVVAPSVVPGTTVTMSADHYSLLATWEDLLGLPRLAQAAAKTSLVAAFHL